MLRFIVVITIFLRLNTLITEAFYQFNIPILLSTYIQPSKTLFGKYQTNFSQINNSQKNTSWLVY